MEEADNLEVFLCHRSPNRIIHVWAILTSPSQRRKTITSSEIKTPRRTSKPRTLVGLYREAASMTSSYQPILKVSPTKPRISTPLGRPLSIPLPYRPSTPLSWPLPQVHFFGLHSNFSSPSSSLEDEFSFREWNSGNRLRFLKSVANMTPGQWCI